MDKKTRRTFLAGGVAGAVALAGCLEVQDRDPDLRGEWTQVGKTATNASYSPDVTLPESLEERWRRDVGTSPYASPVVASGVVFVGGSDGLFAFDALTGAVRWHRELDGYASDGAAVDGETLLVPEHGSDGDDTHRLRALAVEDGADRWSVTFDSRPFAPTVAGEGTFLRTADAILELGDGEVLWRTPLEELTYEEYNATDPRTFATTVKPAVAAGQVVVPDRHAVVALDPDDGTERWRETVHAVNASIVALDDVVIALGLDDVVALEPDGTERWRVEEGRWGGLAVADSEVCVLGANELTALNLDDGTHEWDRRVRGDVVRSSPTVLGDAVLAVTSGGIAFRRGNVGFLQDRELLTLDHAVTRSADLGSGVAGADRLFALDGLAGRLVAFRPSE